MTYRIKNIEVYQHYKLERGKPRWIKLYVEIWQDRQFFRLPDTAKLLFIGLLTIASQNGGQVPDDPEWIAHQLGMQASVDFEPLVAAGFLIPDCTLECTPASTLESSSRSLSPEIEAETEREAEKEAKAETEGRVTHSGPAQQTGLDPAISTIEGDLQQPQMPVGATVVLQRARAEAPVAATAPGTLVLSGEPDRRGEKPKGNRPGARRALPADFTLTRELAEYAFEHARRPRALFEHFCDYWRANGKAQRDWEAVFRNWVRSSVERKQHPLPVGAGKPGAEKKVLLGGRLVRFRADDNCEWRQISAIAESPPSPTPNAVPYPVADPALDQAVQQAARSMGGTR